MTEQVSGASGTADVTRVNAVANEVFATVAGRWALPVVYALGPDTLRFTELRAALPGVSHKMLTQTLRALERDGLVKRLVHPTVPPRVDYSLTEAGTALRATIDGVCDWTRRHLDHIDASRRDFDVSAG
ncbi:winged helix-turn-helix transcriptional regulator [Nocardiopsis ansamitocini]|uniref:HxlR family transcriptional regulator n=1 Tax=Nocardiopsis ansamitocini TaxID=1670832 RepID=A0A9W6P977_9ACTN|nr:helix-turn-helix domain-containing protein [Nocardiopsis ansamitocini]GLU49934.1 HxlR family transcriptional regulator [Nocardiopsis ansamitocini]